MHKENWLGSVATWFAFLLFRGPFARRSKRIHTWTMKLFRYGVEHGDTAALTTYGSLLYFRGADKQSRHQGAILLQSAADKGEAKALWLVGKLYLEGAPEMFQKNEIKAISCFERAAKCGHPLAVSYLEQVAQSARTEANP